MKNRAINLDVIRICAITIILVFHFNAIYLPNMVGRHMGAIGINLFFLLSGFLLKMQYPKYKNLKDYYKRRLRSIYPLVIMSFIVFYFVKAMIEHNFLYGGNPLKIIYSLLGIDGYLKFFNIETYFVTGEWFTAGIIYLYLIFPLLNLLMDKYVWVTTPILFFLYYFSGYPVHHLPYYLAVTPNARFLVITFVFWLGMLLEYINERKPFNYLLVQASIIAIVVVWTCINYLGNFLWLHLICPLGLFLILYISLKDVEFPKVFKIVIVFLSRISFAVYLIHHQVFYLIQRFLMPRVNTPFKYILVFFINVFFTIILSSILYYVSEIIVAYISSLVKDLKVKYSEK